MKAKGRIFSGETPVTPQIEFVIERDDTAGAATWRGSFRKPRLFEMSSLPGGVGVLELTDGRRAHIFLLSHDPKTGHITFHLPGADLSEVP